jgi:phage tail sheath protein FI
MVQVTYPGVYVNEERSGSRTITGVSTSVAAFVGMAKRGRVNEPTRVLNYTEFERAFTSDTTLGEMALQVRQFFLNGGQTAFVVRTAKDVTPARVGLRAVGSTTPNPPAVVLTLEAKDAGGDGNMLRARVDYDTGAPERTFNITLYREAVGPSGALLAVDLERHTELSMDPNDPRFVVAVLESGSALARARVESHGIAPRPSEVASGRLFADADAAIAAINAAIGAEDGAVGRFEVRLGNGPWRTVQTPKIEALDELGTAITTALGAAVEVVVAGESPIVLRATGAVGRDLFVRRAQARDIAQALALGGALGGLDVGSHASARPAPTGWSTGASATAKPIDDLVTLAKITRASLGSVEVSWPGAKATANVTYTPSTGTLATGAGGALTLASLRGSLEAIARAVNGATPLVRATVQGFRIVLTPTDGVAGSGVGVAMKGPGSSDAFQGAHPNVRAYTFGIDAGGLQGPVAQGNDGEPPGADEYDRAFYELARKVDVFNLLVLPRSKEAPTGREDVWPKASALCLEKRAFLLVDPDSSWADRDAVSNGIVARRTGLVGDHAAVYWPRIVVAESGRRVEIDPSGSIAGVMARIDGSRGVWKAPAGVEAEIRGALGVATPMSDPENGVLNPLAVNAIRAFPNGIVSWGARTMAGFDNSGNDDYKYVPIRRLALFLEESLVRGLRFAVFEPNDEPLWRQIRLAAGAFMNNLFRKGAFQGQKASDAYFVKVDSETTTQNDINLGIVNVVIGFAPLRPAEFVVLHIRQMAGQVQV